MSPPQESPLPLAGLKVLDLSQLAPGPYCTRLLADMGAEVLVVEAPEGVGRRYDPRSDDELVRSSLGRNKRSITLDLKSEQGRAVFDRLVADADVLLEGFRPGAVARLGVDYATVSEKNERLVYCSLSGYGQTGPYAALPGHDVNYTAIGGALGMVGSPGAGPAIPMNVVADFAGGGLFAAFAILVALRARDLTGRGQYVDMAMSDGVASLISPWVDAFTGSGSVPGPGTEELNGAVPYYACYETADGRWLSIGCIEPWFWERLCVALECPELVGYQHAVERHGEIFARFRECFARRTRDEWFQVLAAADVCVAPVLGVDELVTDPHMVERGMIESITDPRVGEVTQVGVVPKLSATPGSVRTLAPTRGQHTAEVLREHGYDDDEITGLEKAGIT